MTPEYTQLFGATTNVVRGLQDTILLQACALLRAQQAAQSDANAALQILMEQYRSNIAAMQIMQAHLVKAQQDAEELYLERTD